MEIIEINGASEDEWGGVQIATKKGLICCRAEFRMRRTRPARRIIIGWMKISRKTD